MKAKGEQMERAIQAAGGAVPAPHAVPPKYATAEQMERLIDVIANGGGGGATSLNDLSDVAIKQPLREKQTLVYKEGDSSTLGCFKNRQIRISDLEGFSWNVIGAGITLISDGANGVVFDYYQCAESPTFDASITQAFEQFVGALKPVAKSAGKAGTKLPMPNASGIVSELANIQDTKKRIPIVIFGDYVFFPKGRISSTKYLFSSADTDTDGVYDIIFAIDATANAGYVTVEYTACPAMS